MTDDPKRMDDPDVTRALHGEKPRSVRTKVTRFPLVRESATLAAEIQDRLGDAAAAKAWLAKQGE